MITCSTYTFKNQEYGKYTDMENSDSDVKLLWNRLKNEKKYKDLQHNLSHRVKELEQEKIVLQSLNDYLINGTITYDELVNFYANLMNSMVPVRAYLQMLLEGNFGELTDKQKEKLSIIHDAVMDILRDKPPINNSKAS